MIPDRALLARELVTILAVVVASAVFIFGGQPWPGLILAVAALLLALTTAMRTVRLEIERKRGTP